MRTASSSSSMMKFSLLDKCEKPKNYAQPEVLCHTFDMLSNLHKLLPNHLMETLYSYRSEEDKKKCENPELSGLERILARHQLPKEINLTPKPNRMPLWKRKIINNVTDGWKKCHLLRRNTKEPPMSTIVVRWLKKNMQPTEDLKSVICRLSAFGPIQSVTVCGRQSAIVAFKDMTSACNAVSAFQRRTPGTMFQCSWQQRFMSKDKTYSKKCTQKTQPKEYKQETEKTANS
uniref:RRM domain-containing protein n=1 Tax=Colobus angolensis palliatus TaxID=336983 RepID=A0A2K5I612_COLAP